MIGLVSLVNPSFKYTKKGFTSIINQLIDIAVEHYIKHGTYNVRVVDDEQVLYFYDNVNTLDRYDYDAGDYFLSLFFNNSSRHNFINAHSAADIDDLRLRNIVFSNILTIKPEYYVLFKREKERLQINEKTLAVHIRGTDKNTEIPKIDDEIIVSKIHKMLIENELDFVFLCTDDKHYLDLVLEHFGNKVIYNDSNKISITGLPLHFSQIDRPLLNRQVLMDVYLLSQCPHFLYCLSNVSYLALCFGCNNFKSINLLNQV